MKQKKILISIAATVGILSLVYLKGRKKGKEKGFVVVPSGGSVDTFSVESLAQEVNEAFEGFNFWSSRRRDLLNQIWFLNDSELIELYNFYNKKYLKPPKTLKSLIAGEWIFGNEVNRVINRMTALNLP
jgi:hypothetical protein